MNRHRELAQMMRTAAPPVGGGWWTAGGLDPAKVLVAFEPMLATDYTDSKINRVSPGMYDADIVSGETNPPTFSSGTGWLFADGRGLAVPFGLHSLGGEQVVIAKVSGIGNTELNFVTGLFGSNASHNYWLVARTNEIYARYGGAPTAVGPGLVDGVIAMRRTDSNTNTEAWKDGVMTATQASTYDATGGVDAFTIGCSYTQSSGDYGNWLRGYVMALFVGQNLTDAEVVNISNAMTAL